MKSILEYLKKEYYSKCAERYPNFSVTDEQIMALLAMCEDRTIVIRNPDIKCVAIYLTLTDETYDNISQDKIMDVKELSVMLQEKGCNFHFFLISAVGFRNIRIGMMEVKKLNPKTVSWYNPDMTQLHQYSLN